MAWMNNDGLYIQYGAEKYQDNRGGEYVNDGQLREIELTINLADLTEVEQVMSDTIFFPKVRVQEIEVTTITAAAGGVAIDLGLVRASDRTTEIDFNGFLAAFPLAQMDLAGERTILAVSSSLPAAAVGLGALVGTTTSLVGHITCSRTTAAAFTAGVIKVRIRYLTV